MAKRNPEVVEWRLGKKRLLPAHDIEMLVERRGARTGTYEKRWETVGYVSGDPSGYHFTAVVDIGPGEVSFTQKQTHGGGMSKTAEEAMRRAAAGETD